MSDDMNTIQLVDLKHPRRVHIVGLGGAGMSAIAEVLVGTGHRVSGSDLVTSAPLERLADAGVEAFVGHRAEQIGDAELVAISTAIPDSNPEVVAARERGIPVLRRAEILTAITASVANDRCRRHPRQDDDVCHADHRSARGRARSGVHRRR